VKQVCALRLMGRAQERTAGAQERFAPTLSEASAPARPPAETCRFTPGAALPTNHRGMSRPLFLTVCAALTALAFPRLLPAAEAEFKPIFNGRDLAGWEGNPKFWSVRDGAIRGETSLGVMTVENTFLIWRGGTLKDFQLKLKVRIRNGNSGVQYRARDLGKWIVAGYQAEIDNAKGKSGFLYEERGRKSLALIGEKVELDEGEKPRVTGQLAGRKELIAQGYYKARDWNDYLIVAKGNRLEHFINGTKVIDVTDHDAKRRALEGLLALQIHAGPPMLVEFKDILLQTQ